MVSFLHLPHFIPLFYHMKSLSLRLFEYMLRQSAKAVLLRHRPRIIGVTGSVGKSSAKEAIALALSGTYRVRRNTGNFNNEIGIPLVILGADRVSQPVLRAILVPFFLLKTLLLPRSQYPEILVLELGIDRIGDMDYLLSFLPASVGVVTNISSSHLAFLGTIGTVAREKGKLVTALPKEGVAVLVADEPRVLRLRERTKARVLTYGFDRSADISATHLAFFRDERGVPSGSSFKLEYHGKSIPVRLPSVIAEHHILAVLAGVAVAVALKINPLDAARSLESFCPLPGRLRLILGARRSLLIDDTYNASPTSLSAALRTLSSFGGMRKMVAFGDMLELGSESRSAHEHVATLIRECGAEEVFLAGEHMRLTEAALVRLGFSRAKVHWFDHPETLGRALLPSLREGDVVLFKGSQGMRMEKAVEITMEDPAQAKTLLPRQSEAWKKTPFLLPRETIL